MAARGSPGPAARRSGAECFGGCPTAGRSCSPHPLPSSSSRGGDGEAGTWLTGQVRWPPRSVTPARSRGASCICRPRTAGHRLSTGEVPQAHDAQRHLSGAVDLQHGQHAGRRDLRGHPAGGRGGRGGRARAHQRALGRGQGRGRPLRAWPTGRAHGQKVVLSSDPGLCPPVVDGD